MCGTGHFPFTRESLRLEFRNTSQLSRVRSHADFQRDPQEWPSDYFLQSNLIFTSSPWTPRWPGPCQLDWRLADPRRLLCGRLCPQPDIHTNLRSLTAPHCSLGCFLLFLFYNFFFLLLAIVSSCYCFSKGCSKSLCLEIIGKLFMLFYYIYWVFGSSFCYLSYNIISCILLVFIKKILVPTSKNQNLCW